MDRRQFVMGTVGGLAALQTTRFAFAQEGAVPAGYPSDYAAIIEASRSETDVVMYTSFSESFWQPVKDKLATLYPWIDLQTLDLGGPEIVERYRMETGASARTADILVFNGPGEWFDLSSQGALVDYRSAEIANLPDWSLKLPGAYFATVDADVFLWNKLLLPEGPTSLEALVTQAQADPDTFNGRITTYAIYQQSSYYLAFRKLLEHHGEKLWDWLAVLAPLTRIERSGGTMYEKVLSGEYLVTYYVNQQLAVLGARDPQKSQVVGWAFPTDGTTISGRFAGIPVATQAPNSARLILDFLLSKEGQLMVAEGGRFPYRSDVTPADVGENAYTYQMVLDTVGAENALLVEYDPALMEDQDAIIARWKSIYEG
jgi:iron(III) transport system substrate-binding protein